MDTQDRKRLIAYCGMDCAMCRSYQSGLYHLKQKGMNYKVCPGCKVRGLGCVHMANSCELIGKGQIDFCFECKNYPCDRLKRLDKRYQSKYHMSMIDNLNLIKDKGLETFISSQNKFACQDCGEYITVHNGICLNCHLNILKDNPRYRWGEEE